MRYNVLLIDEIQLKNSGIIDKNISPEKLKAAILLAQNISLQSIIGTSLLEKLQLLIRDGMIGDDINYNYKNLIDYYIQDFLLYSVLSELQMIVNFPIANVGTYTKISEPNDNKQAITLSELKYMKQYYSDKADFYAKRMADYICDNINEYPEYHISGGMVGNIKDVYRCNLNI